jgi:hypothetical protein
MGSQFNGLNLSIDDIVSLFPTPRSVHVTVDGASCDATAQREMGRVLVLDDKGLIPAGRATVTVGGRGGAWRLDGDVHRDGKSGRAFITVHRGARFNRRTEARLEPPRNGVRIRPIGTTEWQTLAVVDLSRSGMQFRGFQWPLLTPIEIDGLSRSGVVRGRIVRPADDGGGVRFQRLLDDLVA